MPPIPVHIEAPIAPAKAQGITPETQSPQANTTTAETTTTSTLTYTQSYPAARPGQAAVPGPTSAVPKPQPVPTRTYNPAEQADLPPPPQPGQAPQPNNTAFQANATGIPPPPTASSTTTAPAQTQWAPPQQNYAPTHTTDPATPRAVRGGPTTLDMGPVTSSPAAHPPGYQQNVYAQELSPAQRASLDQQEAREKQSGNIFGDLSTPETGDTAENVWNAVKSFGAKVGETAAKAHTEAWKLIDGKT